MYIVRLIKYTPKQRNSLIFSFLSISYTELDNYWRKIRGRKKRYLLAVWSNAEVEKVIKRTESGKEGVSFYDLEIEKGKATVFAY